MGRHLIAVETSPAGGLMIVNSYDANQTDPGYVRRRAETLLAVWPRIRVYLNAEPDIWGSFVAEETNVEIYEKGD